MECERSRAEKVSWAGRIVAVQPRIRLMRSFDERHHSYQGYILRVSGACGGEDGEFLIAIGKAAQEKYRFRAGMEVAGLATPVADSRLETAGFYKASGLKMLRDAEGDAAVGLPCVGTPLGLETYRSRGHRRLAAKTYETTCFTCIWGCRMPVEMIIDHWNPSQKRYRFETFCYGPKNCVHYRTGAKRKVPGRRGMSYTEEDRVDEEATSHRDADQ